MISRRKDGLEWWGNGMWTEHGAMGVRICIHLLFPLFLIWALEGLCWLSSSYPKEQISFTLKSLLGWEGRFFFREIFFFWEAVGLHFKQMEWEMASIYKMEIVKSSSLLLRMPLFQKGADTNFMHPLAKFWLGTHFCHRWQEGNHYTIPSRTSAESSVSI